VVKLYKEELETKPLSIKLFASLRQAMRSEEITVNIEKEITVSQMKKIVLDTFPNLKKLSIPFLIAVNHRYVKDSDVIGTKDEVALIPPVSGG